MSSDGPNILIPTEIMHAIKSVIHANSAMLSTFYAVRSSSGTNSSSDVSVTSSTSDITTSEANFALESILCHYSESSGKNANSLNHLLEVLRDSRMMSMSLYLSLSSQRKCTYLCICL